VYEDYWYVPPCLTIICNKEVKKKVTIKLWLLAKKTHKPSKRQHAPELEEEEFEKVRNVFCYTVTLASQNSQGTPLNLSQIVRYLIYNQFLTAL
jgi:hypothetical protein